MKESPLLAVLRERASLQPNDVAFTFHDDDDGEESMTWGQLHRRSLNLAIDMQEHTSVGDRAVILAPQSLEYVVAFLAALQAGVIAVPLSVPLAGIHDERITAVLRDASPTAVLTTSAVAHSRRPLHRGGCAGARRHRAGHSGSRRAQVRRGASGSARHRISAVHVRIDALSRRRRDHPRQPGGELEADRRGHPARLPDAEDGGVVAAVLPRHG